MLLPNSGGDSSSYLPIYLLESMRKLFVCIICNRLLPVIDGQGFCAGRSTEDVINAVINLAEEAIASVWRQHLFKSLNKLNRPISETNSWIEYSSMTPI